MDGHYQENIMMEFPILVYKSPGPHRYKSHTYDYTQVKSGEDLVEASTRGYFPTIEIAISNPSEFDWEAYGVEHGWWPPAEPEPEPDPDPDPEDFDGLTREELEKLAEGKNITVTANMKDETIIKKLKEVE